MKKIILFIFTIPCLLFAQYSVFFDTDDYAREVVAGYRGSDETGTVAIWVNLGADVDVSTCWFSTADEAGDGDRYFYIGVSADSTVWLLANTAGDGANGVKGNTVLQANTWYHVVIMCNDTPVWKIYLNGVAETLSVTNGGNIGLWFADIPVRDNLVFGCFKRASAANVAQNDYIDEVAVFSDTLTTAELTTIYNGGRKYDLRGFDHLVSYFMCNEGTGTTLTSVYGGEVLDFLAATNDPSWASTFHIPTTVYVDTTSGDDSWSGVTVDSAWATLDYADDFTWLPNDSIALRTGTTQRQTGTVSGSGTSGNPITFTCYDSATGLTGTAALALGGMPIISGADLVSTFVALSSWQSGAIYAGATGYTDDDDTGYRVTIPASTSSYDGTKIRLSIKGNDDGGRISGSSIGLMTTVDDFDVAPTRITWNTGDDSSGSVANGVTLVSDEITFTFDKTLRYGIHFDCFDRDFVSTAVGAGGDGAYYGSGPTTDALVQNITYTPFTTTPIMILLEVYSPTTNTWVKLSVSTEPKTAVMNGTFGDKKASIATLVNEYDWFWSGDTFYIYAATDPDTRYVSPGVEIGQRNIGILTNGKRYLAIGNLNVQSANVYPIDINSVSDNIIVQNCVVRWSGSDGICFWTNEGTGNDLINNNTIQYNQQSGISARVEGHKLTSGNETTISNNTVNYNGEYGIYILANYWIVENNTVHNNGMITAQSQGISTMTLEDSLDGKHNIIRFNSSYDHTDLGHTADGNGITMDQQCDSNQVYYNLCYGNPGAGISLYENKGNVIYNNVSYNNAKGSGMINKAEIRLQSANDWEPSVDNTLKNNIAVATTDSTYSIQVGPNASDSLHTITNNLWFNSTSSSWYVWDVDTGATLATWNGKTGVGTDLNSDPLFTDAANDDFLPLGTSPCLNAGVFVGFLGPDDVDFAGISIEYPPDIGAYEFDSGIECPDLGGGFKRFLRFKRFLSWGGAGGSAVFPYTFPFCLE